MASASDQTTIRPVREARSVALKSAISAAPPAKAETVETIVVPAPTAAG